MDSLYDWAKETEWTSAPEPVNGAIERRPRANAVTGHVLGCRCAKCPGWYVDRAEMVGKVVETPEAAVVPAPRAAKPLVDVVLPVSVLMVVFTICAMVLLPVVTPLVALSALSLGLVAVSIAVIAVVGLVLATVVRRTARETRVVRGRVVNR